MQAEIYVVWTKIFKLRQKSQIRTANKLLSEKMLLTEAFEGITVIPNLKGEWIGDLGLIDSDEVEIWRFCTNDTGTALEFRIKSILYSAKRIKRITSQKCQMVTINRSVEPIFL